MVGKNILPLLYVHYCKHFFFTNLIHTFLPFHNGLSIMSKKMCTAFYKQSEEDAKLFMEQGLWQEASDLFTIAANARQWVTYKHIGSWDHGHIKAYHYCLNMANHCTYMASVL